MNKLDGLVLLILRTCFMIFGAVLSSLLKSQLSWSCGDFIFLCVRFVLRSFSETFVTRHLLVSFKLHYLTVSYDTSTLDVVWHSDKVLSGSENCRKLVSKRSKIVPTSPQSSLKTSRFWEIAPVDRNFGVSPCQSHYLAELLTLPGLKSMDSPPPRPSIMRIFWAVPRKFHVRGGDKALFCTFKDFVLQRDCFFKNVVWSNFRVPALWKIYRYPSMYKPQGVQVSAENLIRIFC